MVAGFVVGPSFQAQSSPICQFAITAYVVTQLELESARKSASDCTKKGRGSCKGEFGRIRELQHRLKLARDYLDRYCVR